MELEKLDDDEKLMNEAHENAEKITPGPDFLKNDVEFYTVYGKFERSLTLVAERSIRELPGLGAAVSPFVKIDAKGKVVNEEEPETPASPKVFTIERALVLIVAIVAMAIMAERQLLPPMSVVVVIAAALGLAFYPQLRSLIDLLLAKEEHREPRVIGVEDWINESFSVMRKKFSAGRSALMFKGKGTDSLPDWMTTGVDPALYDQEKRFREDIPAEFLSRMGDIVRHCHQCCYEKRRLLIQAIQATKQATAPAPPGLAR